MVMRWIFHMHVSFDRDGGWGLYTFARRLAFARSMMCVVMGLWCDVPTCRTIFYHHPHPSGFDSDNYIKWMSNVMGPRDLNIKGHTIERFTTIIYFKWRGKRERVLQERLNWRWGKFPLTISADNGLHFINLLPDIGDFGICFFLCFSLLQDELYVKI